LVAALGLPGLIAFLLLAGRITADKLSVMTKAVVLVWLSLNFVAGPVGVPILGVIVGTLFRSRPGALADRTLRGAPR